MSRKFKYDEKKEIIISEKTFEITPYTWSDYVFYNECDLINVFFDKVQPTDNKCYHLLDIGAQTGLYTLYSKFLKHNIVHAFEPFKESFDELNQNLKLNGINNVITYNLAIGNSIGRKTLNTCKHHNGLHTIGNNLQRFSIEDSVPITIKMDTIDNLFYGKKVQISGIKCDIEGYEYFMLLGGKKIIEQYHPLLLLEYNLENMLQCNVNSSDLDNFLTKHGYKLIYEKTENRIYQVPKS